MMLLAIIGVLLVLNPWAVELIVAAISQDLRILAIAIGFIFMTVSILLKRRMGEQLKVFACLFYYGFFGFTAYFALTQLSDSTEQTFIQTVNVWLIKFVLVSSIIRAVIVFLVLRMKAKSLYPSVARNMKDNQYKPLGFIFACTLAIAAVFILDQYYEGFATIGVLAFSYSNATLLVIGLFIRKQIEYPSSL